jgi:hypothetical protein
MILKDRGLLALSSLRVHELLDTAGSGTCD